MTRLATPATPPRLRSSVLAPVVVVLAAMAAVACQSVAAHDEEAALVSQATGQEVVAFDRGLADGWQDYGWAATVEPGQPARVDLGGWGGWIVANPTLDVRDADVLLRLRLPGGVSPDGPIRVGLGNGADEFPQVTPAFTPDGDAWSATVAAAELNPGRVAFDRIVLQAARDLPTPTVVEVERIALALRTPPRPQATATANAAVSADCSAGGHDISPSIYGVAFSASRENGDDQPWGLSPTARRWGGNPTSRYNWQHGHAWNTAADYYWRNVAILDGDRPAWQQFLEANAAHGVAGVVSVPTIGWVAKDTSSYSFPVSAFGEQAEIDPYVVDAGNGVRPDGTPIEPGPPQMTSVEAPPSFIGAWVQQMAGGGGAPMMYVLDNEPDLWHDTHRDVHPEPVGYDELAQRSIDYGSAVRAAAPSALIAGPAAWGWVGYFYSARDAQAGYDDGPDRRAHEDEPLLEWYIDAMRDHQARTGVRVLDVLDVHYYPQARGVYTNGAAGAESPETGRLRVRSTRSLWDPSYEDESWIGEEIQLLPRMQQLIAEHDPSLELSIGEYSFGGDDTPSGAVAQAEALGRFAQFDVYSAFSWTYPSVDSAAGTAFRAFRDFDGQGGHFLDRWVPSTGTEDVSLFTSTDGRDVVAVLVNRSDTAQQTVTASFARCGTFTDVDAFQYDGSANALTPLDTVTGGGTDVQLTLPPWSITTVRLSAKG